ncbi:MAG TPA: hypothetical protein VGG11_18350 [Xanthobacteraceae bacterium]|jgi:hypothetical protein
MASILPFLRVKSDHFDDEATRVMGEAFDMACAELQDSNLSDLIREMIAERIIEAAKKGERRPQRLCSVGVAAVSPEQKIG